MQQWCRVGDGFHLPFVLYLSICKSFIIIFILNMILWDYLVVMSS